MVVKVKVSGHNVEGQGRCDGVELRWLRVIQLNVIGSMVIVLKVKVKIKVEVKVKVKVKVKVIGMV